MAVLFIRIRSDQKLIAGSGYGYGSGKNSSGSVHLRIRNAFEVILFSVFWKSDKVDDFSKKCSIQKYKFLQ
jgi:hypothetical protein